MMPATLLTTKIHIPPPSHTLAARPRLSQQLEQALQPGHKLTLLLAPAGFGKTTVLSEWIERRWCQGSPSCRVAWLSLDEGDNELAHCLSYLVASLQTVEPELGAEAMAALFEGAPPRLVLALLLNDLARCQEPVVLALDDYHVIEARPVHEAMTQLLERLPPSSHLIVASRADPPLPLARLRAHGQLTEIRIGELRFTGAETEQFLNGAMKLQLSPAQVAALERRTEGWIAGLHLAALSLQNRPDAGAFIDSFSGSHRFVLDYLAEEVLHRQSPTRRDFLLRTAILQRLSGPLCDQVAGGRDGQAMLEQLEREGLFLIPLDDVRCWYRYHQLFAELLRARLQQLYPDDVPALHARAAAWYASQGFTAEARQHAAASGRGAPDAPPAETAKAGTPSTTLLEPLSARELEVLTHLAAGLTNREIAGRLFIATGTVKRHTANIYEKLGVNNRTHAVVRAKELNLL